MELAWYSIATFTGQELKVKQLLESMIEREQVQDLFGKIIIPHVNEEHITVKKGKRVAKVVRRNLIPSYIFVQMHLDDRTKYLVQNTQGVTRFVTSDNKIRAIPEEEMANLLPREDGSGNVLPMEVPPVKEGDSIRIKEGPFKDYPGVVEEIMKDRGKLKAMVVIFGRSIPVELNFSEVEIT
ncbi:MAG: transcription termination/antitermination protein NusG [Fibromonadaceae bacterium]|jgi:transcriptional antiterminator NusG|nr:transcription termination/antitermination protein NusG [Fibromonadaceae bacterium]